MINPFRRSAELAQQQADAVREHPALADVPLDDFARAAEAARLAQIAARTRKVRLAQEAADDLARRAEALDAAVTGHAAAEQAEAKRIATAEKALTAGRSRLATAATAADKALRLLFDATTELDALVAQTAREMRAAGLSAAYQDQDTVVEFETGGTKAGDVRLRGKWWLRVNPASVVARALYGHNRAAYGIAAVQGQAAHMEHLERTGLFDGAPLPAPFVPQLDAEAQELRRIRREQHAAMDTPVRMSDNQRENLRRDAELEKQNAKHRRERAMIEYGQARANLVDRHGEARVRELEADAFIGGEPYGLTADQWAARMPVPDPSHR